MLKAIETTYKGYRFRSRLEARWAVFFDALGLKWEYEPEGFELGGGVRYLPDFWLPSWRLWVEIKGQFPSEGEIEKCRQLAWGRCEAVLAVGGLPRSEWPKLFGVLFAWAEKGFTERLACGSFCQTENGLALDVEWGHDLWASCDYAVRIPNPGPQNKVIIGDELFPNEAYNAARSARFEHGESGAPLKHSRDYLASFEALARGGRA